MAFSRLLIGLMAETVAINRVIIIYNLCIVLEDTFSRDLKTVIHRIQNTRLVDMDVVSLLVITELGSNNRENMAAWQTEGIDVGNGIWPICPETFSRAEIHGPVARNLSSCNRLVYRFF